MKEKKAVEDFDKLLTQMINNPSFFSDQELDKAAEVCNELLKVMIPLYCLVEGTEKEKSEVSEMLNGKQARRKLEQEVKARREQTIGGYGVLNETTPRRVIVDPPASTKTIAELPYKVIKKAVEWRSEFGVKEEIGYLIQSSHKSPVPLMTREQARAFANYILEITRENVQRG